LKDAQIARAREALRQLIAWATKEMSLSWPTSRNESIRAAVKAHFLMKCKLLHYSQYLLLEKPDFFQILCFDRIPSTSLMQHNLEVAESELTKK